MISNPGDLSASVLIPAPRECLFRAGPISPEQVEGIEINTVKKDDLSKMSFELEVVARWIAVPIKNVSYELRVLEENTTSDDRSIDLTHTESTVRKLDYIHALSGNPILQCFLLCHTI